VGLWDPMDRTDAVALFSRFAERWWIAGGHAIELACGRPIRRHADIDVLVLRRDQLAVQDVLSDWEWWAADPPSTLRPWRPGERLASGVHDIWCRRTGDQPWALQVLLDESEGDDWVSRRDRSVRCPIARIGLRNGDGIPYLRPEIQLYYKAKDIRPKDTFDFDAVLPRLDPVQRRRLHAMLAATYGRAHPWCRRLEREPALGRPNVTRRRRSSAD
jgi:hypothetical protein